MKRRDLIHHLSAYGNQHLRSADHDVRRARHAIGPRLLLWEHVLNLVTGIVPVGSMTRPEWPTGKLPYKYSINQKRSSSFLEME